MPQRTANDSFNWPRVLGIAAALSLHAGLALWTSVPTENAEREERGHHTLVWDPPSSVAVSIPPPHAPQQPVPSANASRPFPINQQASINGPPAVVAHTAGDRPHVISEWHADTLYESGPANPLDRRPVLEHIPTRFDDAWISDGTLVDQLAHRYRAVALIRAATGYQKPCTDFEKRQQLPRCFPKPADPRG